MKKDIHPKYYDKTVITCACGAKLETGSTVEKMHLEICSQCHPFYTGKKKTLDSTGRVDRFKKITEKTAKKKEALKKKKSAKKSEAKTEKKAGSEAAKKPAKKNKEAKSE